MTDEQWLACNDPTRMVGFLRGKASSRQFRLYAAACCRAFWDELPGDPLRRAVELVERCADEGVPESVLGGAINDLYQACRASQNDLHRAARAAWADRERALYQAMREVLAPAFDFRSVPALTEAIWLFSAQPGAAIHRLELPLVRDIFGNPFRPAQVAPAWRTPATVGVARSAYEQRALPAGHLDAALLAVLADALEEAGCTDADVLRHLREAQPHVRGCRVVDTLLSKS
jgi:hypothetical protein